MKAIKVTVGKEESLKISQFIDTVNKMKIQRHTSLTKHHLYWLRSMSAE